MANFALKVFKYRSYTPIPFLAMMLIFQEITTLSLIIGFIILILGALIRFWGVCFAGSETRTTGAVGGTFLIISGSFAYVRNPLYLGNLFVYLGIGIMSMALFPYLQIVALLFFYFQYRIIITEEEKYLLKTFGEKFERYYKSVPRFFPRFTCYKDPDVIQPPFNLKAAIKSETRTWQALFSITMILIIFYLVF
ncbi:MAG: protein-S-isoprenylcysteine methyltransferase [Ignavibacteria bacterium RBG_13_36_8]|nr:MAG: protein-S-isoprenylcysteine methyltransferase [Ignavibacteria bacterium RBG_13_36_8]